MDATGVASVCDQLGLKHGGAYTGKYGEQMSISCPLAPMTHDDPVDRNKSCSVLLSSDGISYANCFSASCAFKGSFFRLIQRSIIGQKNTSPDMIKLLGWIATIDDDSITARAARVSDKVKVATSAERMVTAPTVSDRDVLSEAVFEPFANKLPPYAVHSRGVTVEAAKVWKLGHDVKRGRLVFSVRRSDGRLIGMTGRILPAHEARVRNAGYEPTKYHNYSGLNKGRYLYGTHTWKTGLPVVLVEGPLDAVRTWQALRPRVNVAATLGEGFSQDHRRTINTAWPEEIYLFPDGDQAGRRMAQKIHFALKGLCVCRLMRCPTRRVEEDETGETIEVPSDPGSMTDDEIRYAFEQASVVLRKIKWG